jgi:hypothetical protein
VAATVQELLGQIGEAATHPAARRPHQGFTTRRSGAATRIAGRA